MSDARPGAPRLTPVGAGIAGLVVAASSLFASSAWGLLAQQIAGVVSDGNGFESVMTIAGVIEATVAALSLLLARRAAAGTDPAGPTGAPLAQHLAGATYVVGGLGLLVGAITVVTALV